MDLKQIKLSQELSDKLDKIIDFKLSTHFGEQEALKHVKAYMRTTLENLLKLKLIFGE